MPPGCAALILHEDDALLVLNKPAGLAVQGGTGTRRHVDGMLAALAGEGERPRLVHRLDRDTSGLLVVAKTAARRREAHPRRSASTRSTSSIGRWWSGARRWRPGSIDQPLAKQGGAGGERVAADEDGPLGAHRAIAPSRAPAGSRAGSR